MSYISYQSTKVSAGRSKERISQLFHKYSAERFSFEEDIQGERIIIKFIFVPLNGGRLPAIIPIDVKRYVDVLFKKNPHTPRMKKDILSHRAMLLEQSKKAVWRIAEHWLKATFEAIEFGIITFEDAFLSNFGYELPNGEIKRIGDFAQKILANPQNTIRLLEGANRRDKL